MHITLCSSLLISNLAQIFTAIATLILAAVAFYQIVYIKSQSKAVLEIVKTKEYDYFIVNHGKSPSYEVTIKIEDYEYNYFLSLDFKEYYHFHINKQFLEKHYDAVTPTEKTLLILEYKYGYNSFKSMTFCLLDVRDTNINIREYVSNKTKCVDSVVVN